jgi:D-alanyl-D-alanine carboxypeptidase
LRHQGSQRLAFAYAAPTPEPVVGRAALVNSLIEQKVAIPTPAPAVVPPLPVETAANEAVDPVTTASTNAMDGWVIQIGAMPDRNAAVELLSRAQTAGGIRCRAPNRSPWPTPRATKALPGPFRWL